MVNVLKPINQVNFQIPENVLCVFKDVLEST
jgi:hypothetical protein